MYLYDTFLPHREQSLFQLEDEICEMCIGK